MSEIEQISDRVGIIARGKLVAEGTVSDLRGEDRLIVRVDDIPRALEVISSLTGDTRVIQDGDALRIDAITTLGLDPASVNHRLVASGIAVRELRLERASLESVFFAMTGERPEATTHHA